MGLGARLRLKLRSCDLGIAWNQNYTVHGRKEVIGRFIIGTFKDLSSLYD